MSFFFKVKSLILPQSEKLREIWISNKLRKIKKGSKIIDAGAGECYYKRYCKHLKYVSQDFGKYNGKGDSIGLQTGTRDSSKLDIISDIVDIPVKKASFDAVLCVEVFEHIPRPLDALSELSRIIKKNGTLILTAPFTSLTHYSPFYFYSGFSKNFYKENLPRYGFRIREVYTYGNYFDCLSLELARVPLVIFRKNKILFIPVLISYPFVIPIYILIRILSFITSSSDLSVFGVCIEAKKRIGYVILMAMKLKTKKTKLPSISIILPTYQAEKDLPNCLASIGMQDYPKNLLEVLIIDGGSHDKTLEIAKKFSAFKKEILFNPWRDCDEGKSIGLRHAKGEIIALIDADNELSSPDWFRVMIKPLVEDKTIFGVESPWLIRKNDPSINKYETLLQIADPLARRFHPKMEVVDKGEYVIYRAKFGDTPVIGANGFLWRRKVIDFVGGYEHKFEEVNFIARVVEGGYLSYAKVKGVGIYHYYCTSVWSYIKKRVKIGRKFLGRKKRGQKTWVDQARNDSFLLAVLYNVSVIGPLVESIREFKKSKNAAWFWHPFISWLTIMVYGYAVFEYNVKKFSK